MLEDQSWLGALVFLVTMGLLHARSSRLSSPKLHSPKFWRPFTNSPMENTAVLDCTHATAFQLTHHLKDKKRRLLTNLALRGDSSTDAVLNALLQRDERFSHCTHVTSNHFDVDSFLSVWTALNPTQALAHERLLREAAKIGDFRELTLNELWQYEALRVVCWLNSVERELFYKPFESTISASEGEEEGDGKFKHFLETFEEVLCNPHTPLVQQQSAEEYDRVVREYGQIHGITGDSGHSGNSGSGGSGDSRISDYSGNNGDSGDSNSGDSGDSSVQREEALGLVLVRTLHPGHYYSLFSATHGADVVLACYSGNRFELELKYTTYVDINSRPSLPRVDLHPLSARLNALEAQYHATVTNNVADQDKYRWCCDSITDSGPLMRLETGAPGAKLTKAQRYGHPYERPIYTSLIPSTLVVNTVLSFFKHAYGVYGSPAPTSPTSHAAPVQAKRDWGWSELHEFNKGIDWAAWQAPKQ
jgi:hypothetical protein